MFGLKWTLLFSKCATNLRFHRSGHCIAGVLAVEQRRLDTVSFAAFLSHAKFQIVSVADRDNLMLLPQFYHCEVHHHMNFLQNVTMKRVLYSNAAN